MVNTNANVPKMAKVAVNIAIAFVVIPPRLVVE